MNYEIRLVILSILTLIIGIIIIYFEPILLPISMKKRFRRLLAVYLGLLLGVIFAFFAFSAGDGIPLFGTYGDRHLTGSFSLSGNAGILSFDDTPTDYSGAQVVGIGTSDIYLTGIFWMETVGWATFGAYPNIILPPEAGTNVRSPWYLSGYAWSPNAGWIALNHGESYASGAIFFPDIRKVVGYGYSETLGWVPFGEDTGSGTSGTGVDVDISAGFIGKVNITGSIGGQKTFNVLYNVGGSFNDATMTAFVNVVRKNVSFLIRNAGSQINTNLNGASAVSSNKSMIFKKDDNPSLEFLRYSNIETAFDNDLSRTLIVVGADVLIDVDMLPPPLMNQSRSIIVLKNENGEGGNIWIRGDVKRIEATLFAEKSIWSGDEFETGTLSPYYVSKRSLFIDIPRNQLYIKGGVAGHNTIGGGSKDGGAVCPYISEYQETCTYDSAIKYDWNYFRLYYGQASRRAYIDDSKDAYSVVIEYDPRVLQDPPPGLETAK